MPTANPALPLLVVIAGPTGIGKTSMGIALAEHYQTEIVSADSRQFFKELKIGTAQPGIEELSRVKHHFIAHLSIQDTYNLFEYEHDSLLLLNQLFEKHAILFMVGGSGMYIDAVCNGIDDIPDTEPELRQELIKRLEEEGIDSLRLELKYLDPESYAQLDLRNPKRILRALEVSLTTGKPYSSFKTNTKKERNFQILRFCLDMNRDELYTRIDHRVDVMLKEGLESEARQFYPHRELNALKTVGYSEFFDYFDGTITRDEAIRLIKRNSRRYAKRQLSWFKRDSETRWVQAGDLAGIIQIINSVDLNQIK